MERAIQRFENQLGEDLIEGKIYYSTIMEGRITISQFVLYISSDKEDCKRYIGPSYTYTEGSLSINGAYLQLERELRVFGLQKKDL